MMRTWMSGLAAAVLFLGASGAEAQVKFGVMAPISGPNAAGGAQLKNGAELAVEHVNETGGVLGQKIALQIGDDVSDPKQGVSVANSFAASGVKFVVGNYNSGVAIPASETLAENGVLHVTPAATNPKFTERGLWNTFRTCGRDDQQGKLWADYALANFRGKKIAIVHDKTTYGQGLVNVARGLMNAGGLKEVLFEGVNTGEKDFSSLITKIKTSQADILMWGGLHTEGGLILRQMRDQGLKATMMGGDGINTSEFAAIAGEGAIGTLMSFGPDPAKNPAAKAVIDKFRARKIEPESYTLYAYAAVQVMTQAAEAARSLEPKKVAEQMRGGMTFKTVIGDIAYDSKGDRKDVDFVMYVWKRLPDGRIGIEQL